MRTATVESNEHLLHTAKLTLFAEIAEKTKLAYSDTLSLSPEEIVDLLVGTISKPGLIKKVKSRQMGFAIVWLGGQLFTFFGSDALKLQKVIAGKHKKQKVRTEKNRQKPPKKKDFASEEVKQRKLKAKEIKRQRFLKRK